MESFDVGEQDGMVESFDVGELSELSLTDICSKVFPPDNSSVPANDIPALCGGKGKHLTTDDSYDSASSSSVSSGSDSEWSNFSDSSTESHSEDAVGKFVRSVARGALTRSAARGASARAAGVGASVRAAARGASVRAAAGGASVRSAVRKASVRAGARGASVLVGPPALPTAEEQSVGSASGFSKPGGSSPNSAVKVNCDAAAAELPVPCKPNVLTVLHRLSDSVVKGVVYRKNGHRYARASSRHLWVDPSAYSDVNALSSILLSCDSTINSASQSREMAASLVKSFNELLSVRLIFERLEINGSVPRYIDLPADYKKKLVDGTAEPLDPSIRRFIVGVSSIFVTPKLFYTTEWLDGTPHYSEYGDDYLAFKLRAESYGIHVTEFRPNSNGERIINGTCVWNNFDTSPNMDQNAMQSYHDLYSPIDFHDGLSSLKKKKPKKGKKPDTRNTVSSSKTFSGEHGQGWTKVQVDPSSGIKLNKRGITKSMPKLLLRSAGGALRMMYLAEQAKWLPFTGVVMYPDGLRLFHFGEPMAFELTLGEIDNVGKEGLTALQYRIGLHYPIISSMLGVHCDSENCPMLGFHLTSVTSDIVVDATKMLVNRNALVGFSKGFAGDFVQKYREAKADIALMNVMKNIRVSPSAISTRNSVETAALAWLGKVEHSQLDRVASDILTSVKEAGHCCRQEERKQLLSLAEHVKKLYPTVGERLLGLKEISLALLTAISSHGNNHGYDFAGTIDRLNTDEFNSEFSSYSSSHKYMLTLPRDKKHYDVYQESNFVQIVNASESEKKAYDCLKKFSSSVKKEVTADGPLPLSRLLRLMERDGLAILKGNLFQMITLAFFTMVGIVKRDDEQMTYLPSHLTHTSASAVVCCRLIGGDDVYSKLSPAGLNTLSTEYIRAFSKSNGIEPVVYENILCKFKVCYFKVHWKGWINGQKKRDTAIAKANAKKAKKQRRILHGIIDPPKGMK